MKISSLKLISIPFMVFTAVALAADYDEESLPEVEALSVERVTSDRRSIAPEDNQLLDLYKQIEALQQEVQELRGRLEEQGYQLDQLNKKSQANPLASNKVQEKKTFDGTENFTFKDNRSSLNSSEELGSGTPSAEEKLYQQAYLRLQSKEYIVAEKGFLEQLDLYPRGKFAPNAHYWLGEVHLLNQETPQAAEAFQLVVEKFPTHPKAGDALFKLGLIAYDQHDYPKAKDYFQRVKREFPQGSSARLAEYRLNKMSSDGN
mgnify:CR=1 FL=1